MKFLVYSSTNADTIKSNLGGVDYSYYFVLRSFLPLLSQLGDIEVLKEPLPEAGIDVQELPQDSYYLSFTPPNDLPLKTSIPAIPVFAWEFGTLPDEIFVSETDSWKHMLAQAGRAITHSQYAVSVVRSSLGESFPVVSIPAPLWDSFEPLRKLRKKSKPGLHGLSLGATVLDSADFPVSEHGLLPQLRSNSPFSRIIGKLWDGEDHDLDTGSGTSLPPFHDFEHRDDGKLWSRSTSPWIVLPRYFHGALTLEIELQARDCSHAHLLQVHLGDSSVLLNVSDSASRHCLTFDIREPGNILYFLPEGRTDQEQDLSFCITSAKIRRLDEPPKEPSGAGDLTLDDSAQWHGVHEIEPWGRWTEKERCDVVLPRSLSGETHISFSIQASMMAPGSTFDVQLGRQVQAVEVSTVPQQVTLHIKDVTETDYLGFSGLASISPDNVADHRLLGLGLSGLTVENVSTATEMEEEPATRSSSAFPQYARKLWQRFTHNADTSEAAPSVIYTTVFNPIDGRKNWPDIIKAFVFALREEPGALLLIKITHKELQPFIDDFLVYFVSLGDFQCRIAFIYGYLDDADYDDLIRATSFIVNASRGEGQCLPLMEFMSSGVPAIAPDNTAMADYVSADNAFVVRSTVEPAVWPQDPRRLFRTTRYRINWESLYDAFRESYQVATTNDRAYASMSNAAVEALRGYCSMAVASRRLREFMNATGSKDSQ